jgi:hypothetical protein
MIQLQQGADFVVACVVATEVPPVPTGAFTADMIEQAIGAVCAVVMNRSKDPRFPQTPVQVVLQKNQFSAVCREDYWIKAMAGLWCPAHVARCLSYWQAAANGAAVQDYFGGLKPLWYYSPVSMVPAGSAPSWAATRTETPVIDNAGPGISRDYFRFYKD